jgi:class 3 adenylate cyclase
MKELREQFPNGKPILSLTDRKLDSILLNIVIARANGDGLTLPKSLSLGELENIYGVGLSLSFAQLTEINERLIASCHRLLGGNLLMPAPGQPAGVVTVSPRGRAGLPPEPVPDVTRLLDWTGGTRVTLAIVFTDIVDSTVLGLAIGDAAMAELQRRHFARGAALLAQMNGRQIKTIGDSVMAVFRSVGPAFDYAQAFQHEPGASELRIRVGIHAGPVDVVGEDIAGKEVALAKRVVDAIEGAEIWLSDRAKEDIHGAGTHRKAGWQWHPHEVDLKSFGHARLWSLTSAPAEDGDQQRAAKGTTPAERRSALRISSGENGPYLQTKAHGLRHTERTLKLKIENTNPVDAITGIKMTILSIEPQSEYVGPWMIVENLTLAAGDHCFVPFVSYQEARTETGYSTTRYERSATFLEILTAGTQPKPPRDIAQFVTVRATGIGSAPCDYRCKIWVDRPDGRLRVAAARSPS